jgi:hypothetical protein
MSSTFALPHSRVQISDNDEVESTVGKPKRELWVLFFGDDT